MKNRMLRVTIALFIVVIVGIIYLSAQKEEAPSSTDVSKQGHNPKLQSVKGFAWFKHWDELDLVVIKKYYQRYTVDEMRILWDTKLHAKYSNYEGKEYADTVYPWGKYLARLLELGYPFVDFSDYESVLDTRMCILIPTRIYWHTMNTDERGEYLSVRGLSPDTTWEMYEESLIKQIVVYRINWWRSGGLDPFSKQESR